jgi:hypothetical protein
MEMSLRGEADAELDGDGSVVVPSRLLLDIDTSSWCCRRAEGADDEGDAHRASQCARA